MLDVSGERSSFRVTRGRAGRALALVPVRKNRSFCIAFVMFSLDRSNVPRS